MCFFIFILFLYFVSTVDKVQSDSVANFVKRGASEFSFSYAATDVDSKDGHVQTLTLIKNSEKDSSSPSKLDYKNSREFKDIAELIKLFGLKPYSSSEHKKKEPEEKKEVEKADDVEVIKKNDEKETTKMDEGAAAAEENNKEEKKAENGNKSENQKLKKYEEDDDGSNDDSNDHIQHHHKVILKSNDEIPSHLAPLLNGKLVFYVPDYSNNKRSTFPHHQHQHYNHNSNSQSINANLYSPEHLKSNQNKFSLSSNSTSELIFNNKKKLLHNSDNYYKRKPHHLAPISPPFSYHIRNSQAASKFPTTDGKSYYDAL